LEKTGEENGIATMQVKLLDEKGVPCLDAANWIRFGLAGDGKLIDNQGTPSGSRFVQAYNGRAVIRVHTNNGKSVISAKCEGLATVFKEL
jgi:beta-galactosidase